MTDGIQKFIEILERHIRVIKNEKEPLQVECVNDGEPTVMGRLIEAFTTDLKDAGLIEKEWDCEEEGHEIDTNTLGTPYFGDSGETIEVNGKCLYCDTEVRDVYIFSVLLEGHSK